MEMMTYISARANPICVSPGHTHQSTGWPAVPCECEKHGSTSEFPLGVKFYDLRSAGAEWGTKVKLVKESTTPPTIHCVSRLGSLGYPVREARNKFDL